MAREENQGNIDLIDKALRAEVPDARKADYARAADQAIAALRDFNSFLENLRSRTEDQRFGGSVRKTYAKKFQYVLSTGKTPEQLLSEAEADLQATRAEMAKLAAPKTVKQALDQIAQKHATPETIMAAARKTLEQATAFVREKGLVTRFPRTGIFR